MFIVWKFEVEENGIKSPNCHLGVLDLSYLSEYWYVEWVMCDV